MILFFKGQWKVFGKVFALTLLSAVWSLGSEYGCRAQTNVPILKGKRLSQDNSCSLGLTDIRHNQADEKKGLLKYVDE